ncbi:hypothetical protein FB451DRAFT_1292158 [Mycena latifolia]|nr:hypothetical protein FB451DRAFT_1292158 [Mycena latifolia]
MSYCSRAVAYDAILMEPPACRTQWEAFINPHGTVYYTYDAHRLLTTDDIRDPATADRVLEAYDEWNELLEEINGSSTRVHDAEMFVFHEDEDPYIRFASWTRGRTYEFQPEGGIAPGEATRFWDYAWQFTAHRTYFPAFMETQFMSALAFGTDERAHNAKHATFPFDADEISRLIDEYRQLRGGERFIPAHNVSGLCYHVSHAMFTIEAARATAGPARSDGVGDQLEDQLEHDMENMVLE